MESERGAHSNFTGVEPYTDSPQLYTRHIGSVSGRRDSEQGQMGRKQSAGLADGWRGPRTIDNRAKQQISKHAVFTGAYSAIGPNPAST